MAGEYTLSVIMNARNNAGGVLNQVLGGIGKIPPTVALAAAALAGVGVVIGVSVDKAQEFQKEITTLKTGAGEFAKNLPMVSQGLLKMSVDTATTTSQLTNGMFMVESAGYHGASALTVLQAAAKGAKVGNADLGVTADGTTTIMKDYHLKVSQVNDAVNGLIATVANGKTHMEDLAASLSHVLPTAQAAHVGLTDVEAALATMTGEGVPAADAATYLRQTILSLIAPSAGAAKTLNSIGLTTAQVSDEMHKSLPATLQMITDHLKKKFPEGSAQYVEAIKQISGGSKTMQGMLDLTGSHLADFKTNMNNVSQAVKNGHGNVTGFADVQKTFNFQMDAAKASVNAAFIQIGTKLLPVLTQLLSAVTPLISRFASWVSTLNANSPAVAVFGGIVAGLAIMILATVVPAFWAWAAATIAATWPLLLIAAAVAAAIAIIILVVQHWGAIGTWIKNLWNNIGAFFHNLWNGISGFFVTVWNSIISFAKQFGIYFIAALLGPAGIILALIITHWTQIHAFLVSAWNRIVSFARNFAANMVAQVINLKNQAVWHVQDMIHNFISFFTSLPGKALDWGRNLIQGFINGVKSMFGNVVNAVSGIAGNIKKFLGFGSPTEAGPGATAHLWAPSLMKMYSQGIVSGLPALKTAVTLAASTVHQGLTGNTSPALGRGISGAIAGGGQGTTTIIIQAPFMDARSIAREVQKVQDGKYRLQGTHATITSGGKPR